MVLFLNFINFILYKNFQTKNFSEVSFRAAVFLWLTPPLTCPANLYTRVFELLSANRVALTARKRVCTGLLDRSILRSVRRALQTAQKSRDWPANFEGGLSLGSAQKSKTQTSYTFLINFFYISEKLIRIQQKLISIDQRQFKNDDRRSMFEYIIFWKKPIIQKNYK